ncbi:uncharacterized protein LOC121998652 [Zingiber officinale]|uniref:uncharacterized protein LOC121998652 n=1 Tax=Zingiber officinale TaxID=94328 RepID=UPI001C4B8117|nr:uncharacterized protein LOC121998652 [Zingiber officinale]
MKKPSNSVAARGVHPAPQLDRLAALPSAVLALAVALSAEEQEVLGYLLSSGGEWPRQREHLPELGCRCFGCYKSFWARWDASPNRKLIHRIIDAVEEGIEWQEQERGRVRRNRRRRTKGANLEATSTAEEDKSAPEATHFPDNDDGDDRASNSTINGSKSSARGLMSFIGENFWRVWK